MNSLCLHSKGMQDMTMISNIFIDQYMPDAHGSFVKVYLYLLRCLGSSDKELSISYFADQLKDTEGDIIRALQYWESTGLLELTQDPSGQIMDICLCTPISKSASNKNLFPISNVAKETSKSYPSTPSPKTSSTYRKDYSPKELNQFTKEEELQTLLTIIESYMGRPLKPGDVQLIVFLYKELHFSKELIMYLFEYCIDKGKKHANYIQEVAIRWKKEGISTAEEAEIYVVKYNKDFTAVSKAFGLGRLPANEEQKYIRRWIRDFGFDTEILVEACNRTILQIQKPDFKYANKILEDWHRRGVHTMADIRSQDQAYQETKKHKVSTPNTKNQFNAYQQREYSAQQYSELERHLIEKNFK